jgi:hypothetical protein
MTTLTSPHDLLAAIPFLIGYHPENSLVLVSLKNGAIGMAMRVDYPEALPAGGYDLLASHLEREESDAALLVAYLPSGRTDGEEVLCAVEAALDRVQIKVQESIYIRNGRYRSILCKDRICCPMEGTQVPPISTSRIAAENVVAGLPMPFANLHSLAESLSSLPLANESNWIALVSTFSPGSADEKAEAINIFQRDGAAAVIDLAKNFSPDKTEEVGELAARVLGRLQDIQVRDFALGCHDDESLERYWTAWVHLLRIAPRGYIAPVASLCAALAYERGDGALANCALDLALQDEPSYSLALLLRRVFTAGWPRASFAAMRHELHPKVCAGIFG